MTDPTLFPADFADPVDTSTQVTRIPGIDAPCFCQHAPGSPHVMAAKDAKCGWPFCRWPRYQSTHVVETEDPRE